MKFKQLLLYLSFTLLIGCKPFDMVGYIQAIEPSESLLPPLQPLWDDQQFQVLFPQTTLEDPYLVSPIPDGRAIDIQMMYTQMIRGGISHLRGTPAGYAVLDLNIQSQPTGLNAVMSIINFGLLGLPIVLGAPNNYYRIECIAVIQIMNEEEEILGTYMGSARENATQTLYVQNERKWTMEVFAQSMEEVQRQIQADFLRLERLLEKEAKVFRKE